MNINRVIPPPKILYGPVLLLLSVHAYDVTCEAVTRGPETIPDPNLCLSAAFRFSKGLCVLLAS